MITHAQAKASLSCQLGPGSNNVFPGPIDDEWNQTLPAPKLKPDALARSITKALQEGVEDIYPGDVAQEWLARWRDNPKILERELAAGTRHG